MGMMAGGSLARGTVLGATDRVAGEVTDCPVAYADVVATLYHQLGIDPQTMIHDRTGRPHVLMDQGEVIRELV